MAEVELSPSALWRALLLSAAVAGIALVLFVLPAEYGIDPTGAGAAMGINKMSGYRVSALVVEERGFAQDRVEFPLAPFESVEYKYVLAAGQSVVYSWEATGEVVFDLHSEEEGTDPEDAVTFSVGAGSGENGTYVAPYSGVHGWFWENRGTADVLVTLETAGFAPESITYSAAGEYRRDL